MNTNHLQGLKALVVDDYINICHLVRFILDAEGIESTCATSVDEALEIYPSLKPDILISDIAMPVEDGFSLMRRIRALSPEEGGQVPAIALTAYSGEAIRLEARKAGFQEFMTKPVDIDKLLAVVRKLLRQSIKDN